MTLIKEIWKDIKGYEGLYQVSNYGRVKNVKTNYIFIPQKRGNYLKVTLNKKQLSIHRLVAETFLDKNKFKCMPDENKKTIDLNKLVINHKNENKYDNRLSNLEFCTIKYNTYYSNCIEKCSKAKEKPINQYDLEGNFIKKWNSINEASKELNICQSLISKCVLGKLKRAKNFKFEYAKK